MSLRRLAGATALAALATLLVATSSAEPAAAEPAAHSRYLLYRVNSPEGFNLRRDAFLRAALLIRRMAPPWVLVLPPFPRLPHWKGADSGRASLWSTYFDVDALSRVLPVTTWEDFHARHPQPLSEAWLLVPAGVTAGGTASIHEVPCEELDEFRSSYRQTSAGWEAIGAPGGQVPIVERVQCLRTFAPSSALASSLAKTNAGAVLVDRFERLFWDPHDYDGPLWWEVRRGLRFARRLVEEAARWRSATFRTEPYLAVHWRRGDFVGTGRPVASAEDVATEVRRLREKLGVRRVFVATDASDGELRDLKSRLDFDRYAPPADQSWIDGELAIVDQILAADAVHFVGSGGSTFSTVIMEERELAGLPSASTWNVLCPGAAPSSSAPACEQPHPRRPPSR